MEEECRRERVDCSSNGDWQKKACRPEDLGELMDDEGVEYVQTSVFVCPCEFVLSAFQLFDV